MLKQLASVLVMSLPRAAAMPLIDSDVRASSRALIIAVANTAEEMMEEDLSLQDYGRLLWELTRSGWAYNQVVYNAILGRGPWAAYQALGEYSLADIMEDGARVGMEAHSAILQARFGSFR